MELFIHHLSQTLTTFDLGANQIGDQGAEHLANALQQNEVTSLRQLHFLWNYLFIIYHRHSQHLTSVPTKSVIKVQNILRMHCSKTRYFRLDNSTSYGTIYSSFITDTHNTWPPCQPYQWSRRRTSCECIAAKQGNIAHTTPLPMELFIHHLSQTLTTLNLYKNQIGDQAAEHLANALQQNKVTSLRQLHFLCNYSFIIYHRHSQHLTSVSTKSVLKAQNILRMHCSKTR
jgi:hypothetical protein